MRQRCLVVLGLLALLGCTSMPAHPTEPLTFRSTPTAFGGGDRIEVESMSAQDKSLRAGTEIRVHGRYVLASRDQAWMCFGLTGGQVEGDTWHAVRRGTGEFEFVGRVIETGAPHVAFYSGDGSYSCIGSCDCEVRIPAP